MQYFSSIISFLLTIQPTKTKILVFCSAYLSFKPKNYNIWFSTAINRLFYSTFRIIPRKPNLKRACDRFVYHLPFRRGEPPVSARKTRLKFLTLWKPHSAAMAEISISLSESNSSA